MRQVHQAGDKLFVDYSGKKPAIVDPTTGVVRLVDLFVAVLGASNYTYAEATWTQPDKTFEQGVAHAMAAVLASPRFLFRLEAPAADSLNARFAPVDEYSLASRLSYFLWSTMPDEELMSLAAQGKLRANLDAQVKRMLADKRADNLARNFTGQWVQARDVEGIASNPFEIIMRDAGEEGLRKKLMQAFRAQDEKMIKELRGKVDAMQLMQRIVTRLPEAREPFLRVLKTCVRENPDAARIIVGLMAMYLHLGPYSRQVIAAIDRRIEADVVAPLARAAMADVGATA